VPSGKKSKQRRRAAAAAPPPVQSKGAPRRRQANPRVRLLGLAVLVIAGVGIGLALVFSGGGKSSLVAQGVTVGSINNGLPGAADVQAMYRGIPQKGLLLGKPKAPVQLVMYIDLQCPVCQRFTTQVMPALVTKYVRSGKVQIEIKPWAFIGPDSVRGQAAMFAAAEQNKAYNFAETLYYNQGTENTGWLDDQMIEQAAAGIPGLNIPKLLAARGTSTVRDEINAVAKSAAQHKVTGTPTIFVGKRGTTPTLVGSPNLAPSQAEVEQAIKTALAA
jgi:protein-disulfide isomerase